MEFETHTIIFETPVILMNKLNVILSQLIVSHQDEEILNDRGEN
jgi:hypothetical protein